jgi:hypothetical protein
MWRQVRERMDISNAAQGADEIRFYAARRMHQEEPQGVLIHTIGDESSQENLNHECTIWQQQIMLNDTLHALRRGTSRHRIRNSLACVCPRSKIS